MSVELLAQPDADAARLSPDPGEALEFAKARVRESRWKRVCREFLKCHRRPINVAFHLLTTPLGLFGLLSLVHLASPVAAVALVTLYLAGLLFMVPATVWMASAAAMTSILFAVHAIAPEAITATVCLIVGYFGQDLSHLLAGERTLQSTYIRDQGFVSRFIEHTLLLLPVLLAIASRPRQSPLRLFVARKAVLFRNIGTVDRQADMSTIRNWVHKTQPNLTQSTHYWQEELSEAPRQAFDRLSHDESLMSMIRRFHGVGYKVRPVLGMNELYVTGPPKQSTSDTVFYMGHVDGPWAVFPGARLYRCMLAASPNAEVTTHFPMSGVDYTQPEGYRLETGDAVAFDFNRELHYITREPSAEQTEPRVNLKLHFVAFPASMPWYGRLLDRLTTDYDVRARNLFLQTIDPNSLWQKVKTKWVLGWTKIFEWMVRFVGWTNLAYLVLMAGISLAVQDARWFLATTSFVHYGIYVGTLRERHPVAFGVFRRNAVLFKTVAMLQLAWLYASHFSGEYLSLALVIGGFSLATLATSVLGVNRTYFSAELGFDPFERINRFPYGLIPHPMILGAMVGIGGMLLVPSLREGFGWLLIAHLVCYAIVLGQEIFTTKQRRLR